MIYRYFIEFSFRGTNYHGWQIQDNANSVQGVLNKALSVLLKEDIQSLGAGRTDTGVHAKFYVAHFDCSIPDLDVNSSFLYSLNHILPLDISVKEIIAVKPEAHARFDALSRTYSYVICRNKDPFWLGLAWNYHANLDLTNIRIATNQLYHHSNFLSFSKVGSDVKTSNCKVYAADWSESENTLIFTIRADRFLRNMVRAIVGTLIEVGRNKITPERFSEIIELKDRSLAGASAPAEGLYLTNIEYPVGIYLKK